MFGRLSLQWDEKITTPPGLYLVSIGIVKPIAHLYGLSDKSQEGEETVCPTHLLRSVNLVFACANVYIIFLINHSLHQYTSSQVHLVVSSVSTSLFPCLYFFNFLFYTDAGSLFFVLLMYLHHLNKSYCLASFFGIISLVFRQSNIVWMFFLASHSSLNIVSRHSEKLKIKQDLSSSSSSSSYFSIHSVLYITRQVTDLLFKIFSRFTGYIIVAILFVTFIMINGSVALGDKSSHQVTFNASQFIYFIFTSSFFASPLLLLHLLSTLCDGSEKKSRYLVPFTLVLVTFGIFLFTRPEAHAYLLADNRHYTFYLWRRLLSKEDPFILCTFAFIATLAFFTMFRAIDDTRDKLWKVLFFLCTFLALTPQRLLELRYFIVPHILWRIHVKPTSLLVITLELTLNLLVNFITIGLFVYGKRGTDVRFMW